MAAAVIVLPLLSILLRFLFVRARARERVEADWATALQLAPAASERARWRLRLRAWRAGAGPWDAGALAASAAAAVAAGALLPAAAFAAYALARGALDRPAFAAGALGLASAAACGWPAGARLALLSLWPAVLAPFFAGVPRRDVWAAVCVATLGARAAADVFFFRVFFAADSGDWSVDGDAVFPAALLAAKEGATLLAHGTVYGAPRILRTLRGFFCGGAAARVETPAARRFPGLLLEWISAARGREWLYAPLLLECLVLARSPAHQSLIFCELVSAALGTDADALREVVNFVRFGRKARSYSLRHRIHRRNRAEKKKKKN